MNENQVYMCLITISIIILIFAAIYSIYLTFKKDKTKEYRDIDLKDKHLNKLYNQFLIQLEKS